jgi:hypothetical protein
MGVHNPGYIFVERITLDTCVRVSLYVCVCVCVCVVLQTTTHSHFFVPKDLPEKVPLEEGVPPTVPFLGEALIYSAMPPY